ncbi:cyclin-dependent kinase F-4-like protein isoform X1 [Tanacetum coccineum]
MADIVLRMLFVDISCIIYDLYMKLEYLLCSWDPSKRPTAVEALQHPFFQSCYYIPPSLGSKAPTPRMSPSGMFMVLDNSYIPAEPTIHDSVLVIVYAVGLNGMRAIEHNCTTGYSVFLPNVKQTNNVISSAKVRAFDQVEAARTAVINLEIKRILMEVLLTKMKISSTARPFNPYTPQGEPISTNKRAKAAKIVSDPEVVFRYRLELYMQCFRDISLEMYADRHCIFPLPSLHRICVLLIMQPIAERAHTALKATRARAYTSAASAIATKAVYSAYLHRTDAITADPRISLLRHTSLNRM